MRAVLREKEGLSSDFWEWKPVKGVGEPATIKYCDEKFMVLRWNDAYKTKKVKIVSDVYQAYRRAERIGKIHHATKLPIRKPDVIVEYNKTMGGVDTLCRVVVPYARKGVKWCRKLVEVFMHFNFAIFRTQPRNREIFMQ